MHLKSKLLHKPHRGVKRPVSPHLHTAAKRTLKTHSTSHNQRRATPPPPSLPPFAMNHLISSSPLLNTIKRHHASQSTPDAPKTTFFTDKVRQQQQCWSCPNDQTPSQNFFCNSCGVLQHPFVPISNQDYFSLYGLPIKYDIDLGELERSFRKLQQSIHPDIFASKTPQEQEFSMEYAMSINHSYHILKDPLLRAKYIIYLFDPKLIEHDENYHDFSHLQIDDGSANTQQQQQQLSKQCGRSAMKNMNNNNGMSGATNTRIDMMTLMKIFERRTLISDTFDGAELYKIYLENEETKRAIFTKLSQLLESRSFSEALTQCELLGYYNSMQRDLKQRIPPKFFTDTADENGPIQL